jgi:hypothetical protein
MRYMKSCHGANRNEQREEEVIPAVRAAYLAMQMVSTPGVEI